MSLKDKLNYLIFVTKHCFRAFYIRMFALCCDSFCNKNLDSIRNHVIFFSRDTGYQVYSTWKHNSLFVRKQNLQARESEREGEMCTGKRSLSVRLWTLVSILALMTLKGLKCRCDCLSICFCWYPLEMRVVFSCSSVDYSWVYRILYIFFSF